VPITNEQPKLTMTRTQQVLVALFAAILGLAIGAILHAGAVAEIGLVALVGVVIGIFIAARQSAGR
jgi:hypothetical protein